MPSNPPVNPGGLPDIHDASENIRWDDLATAIPPYDWSENYDAENDVGTVLAISGFRAPRKYQGESGSCGGQATSFQHALAEAVTTRTFEEESAKFVIAQTFVLDGNGVMLGSRMRDNLDLAIKKGVSREALCSSYDGQGGATDAFMNRPQDISIAAKEDALKRTGKSYAYIPLDVHSVAQAVKVNRGAVQWLIHGQNNGTWFNEEPVMPNTTQWRHFMVPLKPEIRHGKFGIWARQSWKGAPERQWFSEDWFKAGYISQAAALVMPSIPLPPTYTFTRDLFVGKSGIDVQLLQRWLNGHGAQLAASGPGSPGSETTYFGELTRGALARYQRDHGIKPANGYFGPITRFHVNTTP